MQPALGSTIPLPDGLVCHLLGTNPGLINLSALECEACLLKAYAAVFSAARCQSALASLVMVASRLGSAESVSLTCLL